MKLHSFVKESPQPTEESAPGEAGATMESTKARGSELLA